MEKLLVTVRRHTWLDYSVSWFVYINGVKAGGEIYSKEEAFEIASSLAKKIGGELSESVENSEELFF